MSAEALKTSRQEGRSYRLNHPKSTLAEAQNESRRRWPEEPHIGLCRAFFLSGWAQAAFEPPSGEPAEP
jgi:hypothetical protein